MTTMKKLSPKSLTFFASLVGCLAILSIAFTSYASAATERVSFLGNFSNGTTLFSDVYDFSNETVTLYGHDVYPIREAQPPRQRVCETTFIEKSKRVCERQIVDYRNRTRKTCYRESGRTVCETTIVQVPVYKRVCEIVPYVIERNRCRYVSPPPITYLCVNPNGEATNQLRLENFAYSADNGTSWNAIPYISDRLTIENATLLFKLDIPPICSPSYHMNDAIRIVH